MAQSEQFVRDRILTFLKKNHDYGNAFSELLDKFGAVAFQVQAEAKVRRLRNLASAGRQEVADERVLDTVNDLFVYAAIASCWNNNDETLSNMVHLIEAWAQSDFNGFASFLVDFNVLQYEEPAMMLTLELLRQQVKG